MSYAMTHLIIADNFANIRKIEEKGVFLLASIAPDAVHTRADFTKKMKASAHFLQPEYGWGEEYEEEPMKVWYGRIRDFYKQRIGLAANDMEAAFLQGYTIHILTDIFNCQLLYAPNFISYGLNLDTFRAEYRRECIAQDNFLYQNHPDRNEIEEAMSAAVAQGMEQEVLDRFGIEDVTAQNVLDNARYQLNLYRAECDAVARGEKKMASFDGLKMVSEKNSAFFLSHVAAECDRLLFDFTDAGRTFKV